MFMNEKFSGDINTWSFPFPWCWKQCTSRSWRSSLRKVSRLGRNFPCTSAPSDRLTRQGSTSKALTKLDEPARTLSDNFHFDFELRQLQGTDVRSHLTCPLLTESFRAHELLDEARRMKLNRQVDWRPIGQWTPPLAR